MNKPQLIKAPEGMQIGYNTEKEQHQIEWGKPIPGTHKAEIKAYDEDGEEVVLKIDFVVSKNGSGNSLCTECNLNDSESAGSYRTQYLEPHRKRIIK